MNWPHLIFVASTVLGALNCLVFVIGYQVKTSGSWRHYPMGRHLMIFVVALGAALTLLTASLIVGPLGPWPWVAVLSALNFALIQRNWLLFTKAWRSTGTAPSEDTVRTARRTQSHWRK